MKYALTGCVATDHNKSVVVGGIVDRIASYAGHDGASFCALFSDDGYAAVCFPGIEIEIPPSVVAEIDADVASLAEYIVREWPLFRSLDGSTTTIWVKKS